MDQTIWKGTENTVVNFVDFYEVFLPIGSCATPDKPLILKSRNIWQIAIKVVVDHTWTTAVAATNFVPLQVMKSANKAKDQSKTKSQPTPCVEQPSGSRVEAWVSQTLTQTPSTEPSTTGQPAQQVWSLTHFFQFAFL